MTSNGVLQILVFFALVLPATKPIGSYMARVFDGGKTVWVPVLRPAGRLLYRTFGVDEKQDMRWTTYALAMLLFSVVGLLLTQVVLRLQHLLPLNSQGLGPKQMTPDLAFNTAASFTTNTNWQNYSPEVTVSYFSNMVALATHNWMSAACGMAIAIALVRGFARQSAAGIGNFWVDVTRSTLYILQHLESLNDTIHDITGVWVRETVPDSILHGAEEVMVDVTPDALINRLRRGDIYSADKIDSALRNWFREGNLSALREIALREVAHEVDQDLAHIRRDHRIARTWATHERIMVCISPGTPSMRLLRRGWRISQRLKGEIVAVYVEDRPPTRECQAVLHNDFALADRLGIPVVTLRGDVASELVRYARENQMTQVVVGHSRRSRWEEFLHGSVVSRLTKDLRDVDILLVAPDSPA